jgi:hypothetical protein
LIARIWEFQIQWLILDNLTSIFSMLNWLIFLLFKMGKTWCKTWPKVSWTLHMANLRFKLVSNNGCIKWLENIRSVTVPIGSMYAIYGNIYHQYTPNVGIYTIHGSYGVNHS